MFHVAVLTEVSRVHRFIWAANGGLGAAFLVVTVFAHAFRVELAIGVLTARDNFFVPF